MSFAYQQRSFRDRQRLRDGYSQLLEEQGYNTAITVQLNAGQQSTENVKRYVGHVLNVIDTTLLGKSVRTHPEKRINGPFFIEGLTTNTHVHGFIRIYPEFLTELNKASTAKLICRSFTKYWASASVDLCGDVYVQYDENGEIKHSPVKWANYISKSLRRTADSDVIFFAEDFHSRAQ